MGFAQTPQRRRGILGSWNSKRNLGKTAGSEQKDYYGLLDMHSVEHRDGIFFNKGCDNTLEFYFRPGFKALIHGDDVQITLGRKVRPAGLLSPLKRSRWVYVLRDEVFEVLDLPQPDVEDWQWRSCIRVPSGESRVANFKSNTFLLRLSFFLRKANGRQPELKTCTTLIRSQSLLPNPKVIESFSSLIDKGFDAEHLWQENHPPPRRNLRGW